MKMDSLTKVNVNNNKTERRRWDTRSDIIASLPEEVEARPGQPSILTPYNVYPWHICGSTPEKKKTYDGKKKKGPQWSQWVERRATDLLKTSVAAMSVPEDIQIDDEVLFIPESILTESKVKTKARRLPYGTVGLTVATVNFLLDYPLLNIKGPINESDLTVGDHYSTWTVMHVVSDQPVIREFWDLYIPMYGRSKDFDDLFNVKSGLYLLPPNMVKPRIE